MYCLGAKAAAEGYVLLLCIQHVLPCKVAGFCSLVLHTVHCTSYLLCQSGATHPACRHAVEGRLVLLQLHVLTVLTARNIPQTV